ncbi:MAG: thiamine pyrophosphate-dependent enzyme [Candidatus Magasanikbacteria bacterium]
MINPLDLKDLEAVKKIIGNSFYVNLQDAELAPMDGVDVNKILELSRLTRGLIFASVEAAQSGHPGSAGKAEQFWTLVLSGIIAFDALDPKNCGRDRVVWSAGHCSPMLYSGLSLIYEALRRGGRQFMPEVLRAVFPEDLVRFRRPDGPQGHIENYYPLSDVATGPSGHGLSAAGGMAIVHRSCGLPMKTWVFMGDAESEEGMTYEARNVLSASGIDNIIVTLDYNHFGIDGPIEEAMDGNYLAHWQGMGWNVIEVSGHNPLELAYAYRLAAVGFGNQKPTVIIAHCQKGLGYGARSGKAESHGTVAKHEEYVELMKQLGFDIPGEKENVMRDIETVLEQFSLDLENYVQARLEVVKENIKPESELEEMMKQVIGKRPFIKPVSLKRPEGELPAELIFKPGDKVATRKAAAAWFKWLMGETAFFYIGAGDLAKSVLTNSAEKVYGIVGPQNPLGRGIRFGIAEQNMAMMSAALTQDLLPGGFQPVSVFGTYAVFSSMMTNCVRLALIGNHLKPETAGFFIMMAAHDGPETGEDGPTHQGLYWMSMYGAYPGIKVYKPFDANETIEMLFYALEKGEPIALSLLRPDTIVLDRSLGKSTARDATLGAYVYKDYDKEKGVRSKEKICLVISGVQVLLNTLEILPELEQKYDVKIVNVTSPQLFEELRKNNPKKADEIFSDEDRACTVTLHAGWKGFLYPFLLPTDYTKRTIAIDTYLKSGSSKEVYELAGLDGQGLKEKIKKAINRN